jgi:hypothetical protein
MAKKIPMYKIIRKGSNIHSFLSDFLKLHKKYSSCYLWDSPKNKQYRKQIEFHNYTSFYLDGHLYELSQMLTCSYKNMYYRSYVHVDEKSKDIRIVKKLLKIKKEKKDENS